MPTSSVLSCLDPIRESLRDRALVDFAQGAYAEYRRATATTFPHWRNSPTACFLFALSMVYEAERHSEPRRAELLLDSEELLAESRLLWSILVQGMEGMERDMTLLRSSMEILRAWLLRLRGRSEGAEKLLVAEIETLADVNRRLGGDAALFHCPLHTLLTFACDKEDAKGVRRALELADEHIPGWANDETFVVMVHADPRLRFARENPLWSPPRSVMSEPIAAAVGV